MMRTLISLLLWSGVVIAAPGDQNIITDKEIEPPIIEQQKRLVSIRRTEMLNNSGFGVVISSDSKLIFVNLPRQSTILGSYFPL